MYIKVNILAIISHDSCGSTYNSQNLDVEIPDQWGKLNKTSDDALLIVLTHYLQHHWYQQYELCLKKEQERILKMVVCLRAVNDVKTAIDHDKSCIDLNQLSDNIAAVCVRIKTEQKTRSTQLDKENPIVLDEAMQIEGGPGSYPACGNSMTF